jgi:hypothetical protein
MDSEKKNQIEVGQKNTDLISNFSHDAGFIFVFKKTEKLTSAIYIITGLFSENEPMKWSLRKKSTEFLSFILNYKDTKDQHKHDFVFHVKAKILELVSLIEVSFSAGLISEMNFSIIKQEFLHLSENLGSIKIESADPEHLVLTPEFLNDNLTLPPLKDSNYPHGNFSKTQQNTGHSLSFKNVRDGVLLENNLNIKKSNRQSIILGLLKKKSNLTIKDIADNVKDCSEKTIQRELNGLIDSGVVKRDGERRWSRYSLI